MNKLTQFAFPTQPRSDSKPGRGSRRSQEPPTERTHVVTLRPLQTSTELLQEDKRQRQRTDQGSTRDPCRSLGNQPRAPVLLHLCNTFQLSSRASPSFCPSCYCLPIPPVLEREMGLPHRRTACPFLHFLQPQVGKADSSNEGKVFPPFYIKAGLD